MDLEDDLMVYTMSMLMVVMVRSLSLVGKEKAGKNGCSNAKKRELMM